jgi:uncharacterized protein (UPF0548 family)
MAARSNSTLLLPEGYKITRITETLGHGQPLFRLASKLLLEWRMHDKSRTAGISVFPTGKAGDSLLTFARSFGLWSVNPCRITHAWRDNKLRRCSVGYSTLENHFIAGAESLAVSMAKNDEVVLELVSISRGSGLLGRVIFPLVANTQRRFFKEQAETMVLLTK